MRRLFCIWLCVVLTLGVITLGVFDFAAAAQQTSRAPGKQATSSSQGKGKGSAAEKPKGQVANPNKGTAAPKKVTAGQSGAAKSPRQSEEEQKYKELAAQLESILKDDKKASIRDSWLKLEARFDAFCKKYTNPTYRALALYDFARCREELGIRSAGPGDHTQAAERFAAFAQAYPKHALAPNSLLKQAQIFGYRLKQTEKAVAVAQNLVKKYPQSEQVKKARELISTLAPALATGSTGAQQTQSSEQSPANKVNLLDVAWKGNAEQGKIVLRCDGGADYQYQLISANPDKKRPQRLYIDLPKTALGRDVQKDFRVQNAPVRRVQCITTKTGTQVILDVPKVKSYTVNKVNGERGAIEVDLSTKLFRNASVTSSPVKLPTSDVSLAEQLGLSVKVIMLDPGHGGKDPGASGNGIMERQFTLSMAKRVGRLLAKKGFIVLYTREDNTYIPLQDRPDLANAKKADLFLSIHANANPDSNIHGLETYYLDVAQSHSAEKVAARENSVSVKNISDLQFILSDFMLSSKLKESKDLARLVHKGILKQTGAVKQPIADNGVRSAPFHVLMGAKMPAILIECGYLSHTGDAARLQNERFLDAQAQGIVAGVLAYRDKLAKYAPKEPKRK